MGNKIQVNIKPKRVAVYLTESELDAIQKSFDLNLQVKCVLESILKVEENSALISKLSTAWILLKRNR